MLLLILQMPELSPQIRLTQVLQRVITGSEQEITCETILAETVVHHTIPALIQIILSLVETTAQTLFSQAINYAGISRENNWKPYTTTWINTGWSTSLYGLVEYMVDQGFFLKRAAKIRLLPEVSYIGINILT